MESVLNIPSTYLTFRDMLKVVDQRYNNVVILQVHQLTFLGEKARGVENNLVCLKNHHF